MKQQNTVDVFSKDVSGKLIFTVDIKPDKMFSSLDINIEGSLSTTDLVIITEGIKQIFQNTLEEEMLQVVADMYIKQNIERVRKEKCN